MIHSLTILGSTGSIGTQALDVVQRLNLTVSALTANQNIKLLEQQIRQFMPKLVAVFDKKAAEKLRNNISDLSVTVLEGINGICEVAAFEESDLVLNAIVGMVGLRPTLAAIAAKKNIALANKETLVAGGALVMKLAKENHVKILPVDSEHSAIFQCLQGRPTKDALKRIILTASGGPFFGMTKDDLRNVTPSDALKHPNWDMGAKITIDSASMMNKGLEIIEAVWLFEQPADQIDVVVHRESIVHSLIEYQDHSVIAQMGLPDMRIPIQYAITYPNRYPSPVAQLDLVTCGSLSFFEPDYETFDCLRACKTAISKGGLFPAAVNGANEEAVRLFLNGKISFLEIGALVMEAMDHQENKEINCLEDILNADKDARDYVLSVI